MLNLPPLEIVKEAGWLTIWLNRPETRNALSSEMIEALMAAFQDIATDQNIRGVTLRGKGNTFCAGGDLKGFKSMAAGDQSFEEITAMSRNAGELFMAVSRLPQIVVVLIEGAAMAGGLGLACAADIVASTRSAKFSLTETMIGIPPAQIAPYIVRRVGPTGCECRETKRGNLACLTMSVMMQRGCLCSKTQSDKALCVARPVQMPQQKRY